MKIPPFKSMTFVALAMGLSFPLFSFSQESKGVTRSSEILRSLKKPKAKAGLTRSVFGNPKTTATRSGFVSRGANGKTRSLEMVEVQVSSQANISLQSIRFKVNSTEPYDETSRTQLSELALALKTLAKDGGSFLIEGHTCSLGKSDHNNALSVKRAEFVRSYLVAQGVSSSALAAIGCGEAEAAKDKVSPDSSETILRPYRKVMIHRKVE